ncbi:arginyl-tRNA synthetase [Lentimicrobium saccharophilum]|uniref:Arginine--tRNA ligase n=1 Tax=Lentimicrobium saccharophilum TaxID=1678841 RepID=A0A0S7C5J3_9BACT|nr:arginine--tRNA ligase [Lentimicrobium saccharophilum]GAP44307.1 arginyl-tRNA synthetase [Lentimicrobium saccharophilum]
MIEKILTAKALTAVSTLFNVEIDPSQLAVQRTTPAFRHQGDFSLVVFPLLRVSRKSPEATAAMLGDEILRTMPEAVSFGVVKGYLNIRVSAGYWLDFLQNNYDNGTFGIQPPASGKPVVVEFSSPNTNKPLHLGHIRNNLLGFSVSELLKANGQTVYKVNLVNDRGIHICKSMLAWKLFGNGETPESSGKKGDKLVGDYYVLFDRQYKLELLELMAGGLTEEEAAGNSQLMRQAREMLIKWEARDEETMALWNRMNGWVYNGFDVTYKRLGIDFDRIYYESQTYLLGKKIVDEGLEKGVLFRKDDGSVWINLNEEGLDEKLLLRSDGTSVYMTQDLGTAQLRADDYNADRLIYVVGNEQNYHFEVLKLILKKLGRPWADGIYHLSYGMVELPEGKMKSREGTVVDADDLMDEMIATARAMTEELGKIEDFESDEAESLYRMVGLGALKYFILKVDPRKNITFNPRESIDFNGNTGPFIQYTHARIRSVLRKAAAPVIFDGHANINQKEADLIILLSQFPMAVQQAGTELSPSVVANYMFEVAKEYNQFYHEFTILKEEDPGSRQLRLALSQMTAGVIRNGMKLLGIDVPDRM